MITLVTKWPTLGFSCFFSVHQNHSQSLDTAIGEQGCHSGDCTRLPPTRPGFDLGLVPMGGLSWLLVLYSAPRAFSPGSPVFPSPQKSTFQIPIRTDAGPPWKPLSSEWSLLGYYYYVALIFNNTCDMRSCEELSSLFFPSRDDFKSDSVFSRLTKR